MQQECGVEFRFLIRMLRDYGSWPLSSSILRISSLDESLFAVLQSLWLGEGFLEVRTLVCKDTRISVFLVQPFCARNGIKIVDV
jgi:hypothetical protein